MRPEWYRSAALACLLAVGGPTSPARAEVAAPDAARGPTAAAEDATGTGRGGAEVRHDAPEVVRLGQRLRCPVCQGMAIGDSPAPMAQDMMRQVRRMWADGRNEGDIAAYFTARYGDWVLLDPPWRGAGLWVWVLPPVALAVGVAATLRAMRRRASLAVARAEAARVQGGAPQAYAAADPDAASDALRAIREEAAG